MEKKKIYYEFMRGSLTLGGVSTSRFSKKLGMKRELASGKTTDGRTNGKTEGRPPSVGFMASPAGAQTPNVEKEYFPE